MGRIKRVIIILLIWLMSISLICFPVYADEGNTYEYSWSNIYNGALGTRPIINSITGEGEFLSSKEAVDGTKFSKADVSIKKEKAYWILSEIHNDNPNDWITADNVRLKISINQVSDNICTVTGEVSSSNAEPYYVTDTITFTAAEPFHLEYVTGSSYVYSWSGGKSKTLKADGEAVSESGITLGYEKLDGSIPGGAWVTSSVELKVVRNSDILKLRKTTKGDATVRMWNLIQRYSDPNYFTGKFHSKMVSYSRVGKLSGSKYKKIVSIAKAKTAGCKTDYDKMRVLSEYIAKRIYYDYPCYNRKTKTTYYSAYDVWKNKRSVCHGYANLYWTMLDALGIPCMMVYGDNHVFNAAYDRSSGRWVFTDVAWCSGNSYYGKGKWQKGSYRDCYFDMDLDYLLTLTNHEIYGVEGVLADNVYYALTPGYGSGGAKRFKNTSEWYWTAVCQKKKKATLKFVSRIDKYNVREIGESAFYGRPDIKTIYIPTTITKIGKYAFCLKNNRRIVKTKVITKLPKSKLKMKTGYRWWARSVKIKKG